MKIILFLVTISFLHLPSSYVAHADETVGEKAKVELKSAKRGIKKGANRVSEIVCIDGDLECAGHKAKNRINESKEAAVDGAAELKNKID